MDTNTNDKTVESPGEWGIVMMYDTSHHKKTTGRARYTDLINLPQLVFCKLQLAYIATQPKDFLPVLFY